MIKVIQKLNWLKFVNILVADNFMQRNTLNWLHKFPVKLSKVGKPSTIKDWAKIIIKHHEKFTGKTTIIFELQQSTGKIT